VCAERKASELIEKNCQDPGWVDFLRSMDVVCAPDVFYGERELLRVEGGFGRVVWWRPWRVREHFRQCGWVLGHDPRSLFVSRCLGHRVPDGSFFLYPRLCVLVALVFFGDRWRCAEEVICGDDVAVYLYAKHVVRGRLPWEMHNRLVMESFVRRSGVLVQYFSEFGG